MKITSAKMEENIMCRGSFSLLILVVLTANVYALSGSGTQADPWLIQSLADFNVFAAEEDYWDDYTRLETDIDLAGIIYTTAVIAPDTDSSSVYFQGTPFTGIFDGTDHTISNLTIDTAGARIDYLGLFGKIESSSAEVKNLGIEDCNITSGDGHPEFLGGLCGHNSGTISNCYAIGSVTGGDGSENFGGLCGHNTDGSISNCYAAGSVTGGDHSDYLGGLCGENENGTITDCYATNSVTGVGDSWSTGGLCGGNTGAISNCYSTGPIAGSDDSWYLGGLCGVNVANGTIGNCYSTSTVTGGNNSRYIGGLCGSNGEIDHETNGEGGIISNCYSTGSVTGDNDIGGLCGDQYGDGAEISNCFWDTQTSGKSTSDGGTGKTTAEMKQEATFTNWDFDVIWKIVENTTYPYLTGMQDGAISDHVLMIELATTYEYGEPGDVLYYVFDASLQVDETVVSATVQDPGDGVHPLVEEDEEERWFGFSQQSPDLAGLADFLYGTFTFTVEYSDGSSESTSVNYAMGNGDPIAPVTQQPQFIYPAHNATGVPLEVTYQFVAATNPTWDITLEWEPEPDGAPGQSGGVERLPYNTTSYGPVILTPATLYSVEIAINDAIETVNADGIPVMMDMDAETHILFTTAPEPEPVGDFCGANSDQPDGYVDYWDLLYFAQRWHTRLGDPDWDTRCDLAKEDNYVDYWDLLVFAQQWHKGQKP